MTAAVRYVGEKVLMFERHIGGKIKVVKRKAVFIFYLNLVKQWLHQLLQGNVLVFFVMLGSKEYFQKSCHLRL